VVNAVFDSVGALLSSPGGLGPGTISCFEWSRPATVSVAEADGPGSLEALARSEPSFEFPRQSRARRL